MEMKHGKVVRYILDPAYRWDVNSRLGLNNKVSDVEYIRKTFMYKVGYELNIENPVFFNEKIQWLKLYNRKPEYTIMVDKYKVRQYVAQQIGEKYLIPLLGVWDTPEEIDFKDLPNQFVLKCNHNSGNGMCICKDKTKLDIAKVKRKLRRSLKSDFYLTGREWPYKDVPRKIIAEKFMSDGSGSDLRDYKFYCFNGIPKYCQVISNRTTAETIDFFDMEWKLQGFTGLALPPQPHSAVPIKRPSCYEEMQLLAQKLAKSIPFVRIDFYEIEGRVYFGEITFFPASGFGEFTPREWNKKIGDMIDLSGVEP